MSDISKISNLIEELENIAALTGAGMAVESGVAPFRGEDGLWDDFDPAKYAHIRSYRRDPERSWELFKLQIEETSNAEPHEGYFSLVELENDGLTSVITQNIDGLHQRAGSDDVIELHGTLSKLICENCKKRYKTNKFLEDINDGKIPRCECGDILRPDVVLFGEQLDPTDVDSAITNVQECDLLMVIGTSSIVQPAASLPGMAKNYGAEVVEINLKETPITDDVTDVFLQGKAGEVLPEITENL
ncbi:MAG: SIR2 family NAD-dependent protein deacylase [Thermoplasmatota archaeon]